MNSIVWKGEEKRESQRWNRSRGRFGKMACGVSTAKSHGLCTVVFQKTLVYDRIQEKYDRLRSWNAPYTVSVFLRISPYTVTDIYDRNTITGFTAKYGRIRSVYGMYTVVYDRLRPYTESVTVDLGTSTLWERFRYQSW